MLLHISKEQSEFRPASNLVKFYQSPAREPGVKGPPLRSGMRELAFASDVKRPG